MKQEGIRGIQPTGSREIPPPPPQSNIVTDRLDFNMDHVCWPVTFYKRDQVEVLRIEANGDIYVKEKLTTNDLELVDAMREYFGLKPKHTEREK